VTERGSSGSAIFSTGGLVIGTLTGGESGCTNTNGADYYGKLSFSWESNGTADSMQLKPWLDPVNDGRMSMEGSFNDKLAVSDFEADTTTIPVGGQLDFFDRSSGNPNSWEWYFEGGEPSSSNDQNPKGIKYASFGKFSVKLSVTNHYGTDTLTKVDYIDVKALVYPNPSNGRITVFTHAEASDNPVTVEIFNVSGTLVQEFRWERIAGAAIQLDLPRDGNFFIVRMTEGDQVQVNKVVVVRVKQD
jgi:PKD repeat protein